MKRFLISIFAVPARRLLILPVLLLTLLVGNPAFSNGTDIYLCSREGFGDERNMVMLEYGDRILVVNGSKELGFLACNWKNTNQKIQKGSCELKGSSWGEKMIGNYDYEMTSKSERTLYLHLTPNPPIPDYAGVSLGVSLCKKTK
jgi:hypothetical protein